MVIFIQRFQNFANHLIKNKNEIVLVISFYQQELYEKQDHYKSLS